MQKKPYSFNFTIDRAFTIEVLDLYADDMGQTKSPYNVFLLERVLTLLYDEKMKNFKSLNELPLDYKTELNESNINQLFDRNKVYYFDRLRLFLNMMKEKKGLDLYPHFLNYIKTDKKINICCSYLEQFKDIFKDDLMKDEKIILRFLDYAGSRDRESFEQINSGFMFSVLFNRKFNFEKILEEENRYIVKNYFNAYFKYSRTFSKAVLKVVKSNEDKINMIFKDSEMPQRLKDVYENNAPIQMESFDGEFAVINSFSKGFLNKLSRPSRVYTELSKEQRRVMLSENPVVYYFKQEFDVSRYAADNGFDVNHVKYILRNVYERMEEHKRFAAQINVFEDKQNLQKFHFVFLNKEQRDDFALKFNEMIAYCITGVDKNKQYGEIMEQAKELVDKFYDILTLEAKLNDSPVQNRKTNKI